MSQLLYVWIFLLHLRVVLVVRQLLSVVLVFPNACPLYWCHFVLMLHFFC